MSKEYDVIVVGAGPGGSTLAALLAKNGLNVLMLDKNSKAGGKMLTINRDGFYYELFPINGVPAKNSLFEHVFKELDMKHEEEVLYPDPIGSFYFETSNKKVNTLVMRSKKRPKVRELLKLLGLRFRDIFKFIKIFKDMLMMKPKEIELLANVSALEFVSRYKIPKSLFSYILSVYGEGVFENPADRTSAAAMIRVFQQSAKDGGGRYYKKGFGHVFELFASAVEKFGGKVLYDTRVEKIQVENGRVTGIITAKNELYSAPIVVSNAGIQPTVLKLIEENHFNPNYLEWVRKLEMNLACVGYRWFLNKPILKYPMNIYLTYDSVSSLEDFYKMEEGVFPEHGYIYLGTTSFYPNMAPPDKQLVYACMSCIGDPKIDIKPYLEKVKKIVKKITPDLFNHIEREETFGPASVPSIGREVIVPGKGGESYGVAVSIGQYGDKRLNGESPIKGLFYVGCDAGGFGLGTHQAVDSGVNLTKMVLNFHKNRKI